MSSDVLFNADFWQNDVLSNLVLYVLGFTSAQALRLGRSGWRKRKARGPLWRMIAQGPTFVVVDHHGDPTREEVSALSTFRKRWAMLGVDLRDEMHFADQRLQPILEHHLLVIGAWAPGLAVESSFIASLIGANADELTRQSAGARVAYLFFLPNPHQPRCQVIIATGAHPQSAFAVARWMMSDRFLRDEFVASGRPFVHILTFTSPGAVPSIGTYDGRYLAGGGSEADNDGDSGGGSGV
jgi:hypothetical protein